MRYELLLSLIDGMLALLSHEHRRVIEAGTIDYEFLDISINFKKPL